MTKFNDEADDYDLTFKMETPAAFCFEEEAADDVFVIWLPKSQVEAPSGMQGGKVYTVTIPNWLAEEKGLLG